MRKSIDVRDRIGSLEFRDMRTSPGLQAADLLAYECRKYFQDSQDASGRSMRWPLRQILLQQHAYGTRYIKYLPRWYVRLQLSGWFNLLSPVIVGPSLLIAYFYPPAMNWFIPGPVIPNRKTPANG